MTLHWNGHQLWDLHPDGNVLLYELRDGMPDALTRELMAEVSIADPFVLTLIGEPV